MRLGRWQLGWSRNLAIGCIWTREGLFAVLFLGLMLTTGAWPEITDGGERHG